MSDLPQAVKLSPSDTKALRELGDREAAVRTFIQTITRQGEQRMVALQQEGREVWGAIAKSYGLDLERVSYAPDDKFETLIPMGINLAPKRTAP